MEGTRASHDRLGADMRRFDPPRFDPPRMTSLSRPATRRLEDHERLCGQSSRRRLIDRQDLTMNEMSTLLCGWMHIDRVTYFPA
jgi:hypothetical protein